jgi:virginiamycin A acetyltransferase
MIKYSSLKEIINSLIRQYSKGKELDKFNCETLNYVQSNKVSLNAIIGHHITIMDGCYISEDSVVDSYTYISFNTLISKTTIGRYNSIASNVNLGHGEHPLNYISTNNIFIDNSYEALTLKDCVIENDVWIGAGSTIKRGVLIGTGAVVGANSFVNKDVPPFAITVGAPAKIINYRFTEKKIEKILHSKWWEHDLEHAKLIIKKLEAET